MVLCLDFWIRGCRAPRAKVSTFGYVNEKDHPAKVGTLSIFLDTRMQIGTLFGFLDIRMQRSSCQSLYFVRVLDMQIQSSSCQSCSFVCFFYIMMQSSSCQTWSFVFLYHDAELILPNLDLCLGVLDTRMQSLSCQVGTLSGFLDSPEFLDMTMQSSSVNGTFWI